MHLIDDSPAARRSPEGTLDVSSGPERTARHIQEPWENRRRVRVTTEEPDEVTDRADQLATHRRYNMKALGRLVDSNRLTGVSRPGAASTAAPTDGGPSAGNGANGDVANGDDAIGDGSSAGREADQIDRMLAVADRMNIPIRLSGSGGLMSSVAGGADVAVEDPPDRGPQAPRRGGAGRVSVADLAEEPPLRVRTSEVTSANRLARRMLDGEIGPGGRISDPRDVPGLILDLAKDVPASVAVSVVRIDEEVEVVGDSVDASIDPTIFTSAFSSLFRQVRPIAKALQEGPLGTIRDVVVQGDKLDLILRPLGELYFLLVLEDRRDPQADLAATRRRMATIAPGMTALLAQQDGSA